VSLLCFTRVSPVQDRVPQVSVWPGCGGCVRATISYVCARAHTPTPTQTPTCASVQLQVGRGAVCRRVQRIRGGRPRQGGPGGFSGCRGGSGELVAQERSRRPVLPYPSSSRSGWGLARAAPRSCTTRLSSGTLLVVYHHLDPSIFLLLPTATHAKTNLNGDGRWWRPGSGSATPC
jgi:hypothetical protein